VNRAEGVTNDYVNGGSYEIEVAGEMIPARASLRPMYDPAGERVRS
jgi:4-methylaminobutanoate oxidase (formaldehyde-forming)